MSYDLPVDYILQPTILNCPPDTTIREAARRMDEARCSSIVIMNEDGKALGIWTERNALSVDFSLPHAIDLAVEQVMRTPVKTIHFRSTIGEAALRFEVEDVHHFLVTDDEGGYRGIITQTDVILNQGIDFYIEVRDVKSVISGLPMIVPFGMSIAEAANRMREAGHDAVVVDVEGVLGIYTERDIVRSISIDQVDSCIGEVASWPLITVPWHTNLFHARNLCAEKRIRHLGITDGEILIGVLAYPDILASIEHDYVKQLQKTIREQEQKLDLSHHHIRLAEKVFETSFMGIVITDAELNIQSVNPAYTQITGFEAGEIIGRKLGAMDSGLHTPEFFRAIRTALECDGCWQGEILDRRKNGEVFPKWLAISAVKNRQGEHSNYVAIFSDITQSKRTEEQLRGLNETLEKRVAEEVAKNREKDHLMIQQSRLAAMGEMIGNIAHQWRQPINALGLVLANIKDAFEYNQLDKEYLDKSVKSGQHLIQKMSSTIEDFRNFFKPNKEKEPFRPCDSVAEAIKLVAHSFKNHNIEIAMGSCDVSCEVLGYPNEFAQVVLNALTNAKDAIVARGIPGEVHIRVARTEEQVTVTLSDNGGGIPEEILGKVFDPYFTTKEKGTGIGLYMSKMIMDNMGGSIAIRNNENGVEMVIGLPLAKQRGE